MECRFNDVFFGLKDSLRPYVCRSGGKPNADAPFTLPDGVSPIELEARLLATDPRRQWYEVICTTDNKEEFRWTIVRTSSSFSFLEYRKMWYQNPWVENKRQGFWRFTEYNFDMKWDGIPVPEIPGKPAKVFSVQPSQILQVIDSSGVKYVAKFLGTVVVTDPHYPPVELLEKRGGWLLMKELPSTVLWREPSSIF